jgi:hypothetical protein
LGAENSFQFSENLVGAVDVFDHFEAGDDVEGIVGKRKVPDVGDVELSVRQPARARDGVLRYIDPDDLLGPGRRHKRHAVPCAAPGVENPFFGDELRRPVVSEKVLGGDQCPSVDFRIEPLEVVLS